MRILSISGILPIPSIVKTNDFIFQIYSAYRRKFQTDDIVIINPVKYNFNPFTFIKRKSTLTNLDGKLTREISNFQVEIFPYFSTWKLRNLHAFITSSIYIVNRHRIKMLFNDFRFDIIHAQYIFPDGMLAYLLSKKYGIPFILTTHNERFYFYHKLSKWMAIKIMRKASLVIPINYSNYLYYKSLGISNIEFIPLGFDESFIRPSKEISIGHVNIFTVCSLIKLKNIDKVIIAFSKLASRYDVTFTIIGDGPERDHLLKLVKSLALEQNVKFIFHIPHNEIADEMYKHDIFIMPSYFETFGRVYFEVMAMGIPVICAKNSGIHGVFKEMEEGISVDHMNIEAISDALEYLISNPAERSRIGTNGKILVENYTWQNIAVNLQSKYAGIIAHHQSP